MKNPKYFSTYMGFFLMLAIIYALSWTLQSATLMGWDVSWGLHEAKRLYAGGDYFQDFYEMTPPMFLYLYGPTLLFNRIFTLDVALRVSFFFFAGGSLWICWDLSKKIFTDKDKKIALLFLLAIANAFLLLPLVVDFGQREHMLILLILPYFLLMSLRLEKKSISFCYAAGIGLLAGIGFAIKPFFLLPYVLLELYCGLMTRRWLRSETIVIFSVFLIYALTTYWFYPSYFQIIIPLAARTYYQGIHDSFFALVSLPAFIYGIFVALFYMMIVKKIPYRQLTTCIFMGLLGFSVSYLLQHTRWYYHDLPAYSFATMLGILLWSLWAKYASFTRWPQLFLFAMTSVIILMYPIHTIVRSYVFAEQYQRTMDPLLTFLSKTAKHQSVYFFSTSMHYEFPAVDYSDSIPVSRYPLLIWVSGYQRQIQQKISATTQQRLAIDNDFFVQSLIDEIRTYKPTYIFVDTNKNKQYLTGIQYDYLQDFSHYAAFRKAWQDYRYLTTIDNVQYRFAIYQRRNHV